ncbi:hypothetical protein HY086_03660 [Candidatus Gottesmanbacteria bacterium]|nr:hypothetical protein [Candidatus Gottesmanbacteria bacterium]
MIKKLLRLPQVIPIILTLLLIAIMAWVRLDIGNHRYFDPDEFMYLNWAYHVAHGSVPYRDFMMFATPLYVYFLTPLYLFWHGIDPIRVARIVSWIISLALAGSVGLAFWTHKKSWLALVAAALVLFLPMPSDKLLEIRPDNLSLLFFMAGLAVFGSPVTMGILFGLSLLTLQKTVLLVAVATVFLLKRKTLVPYAVGLVIPLGLFLLWAIATGSPQTVLYSVTKLAQEHINQVARFNQLPLNFYFLPNAIYYGAPGLSPGLIANHLLWILAVISALALTLKLFVKRNQRALVSALPALLFFTAMIQYIWLSPLKFPQYLLSAAIFVAWLCADLINNILHSKRMSNSVPAGSLFVFLFFGAGVAAWVFWQVNQPKRFWTNDGTYQKITRILDRIPTTDYVFDLEGRTIYFPYPYYACCLALGQFDSILFHQHPTIRDSLKATKTKYIYQAEIARIAALPQKDADFIFANYKPEENGELYVAKNW